MMVALAVTLNIPTTAFLPPFDSWFPTSTFDPIVRTLHVNGIKDFTNDFLAVPHEVIDGLKGPPDDGNASNRNNRTVDLTLQEKSKLRGLRAFFHHQSRIQGGPITFARGDRPKFLECLASQYDHLAPIVPWGVPVKTVLSQE